MSDRLHAGSAPGNKTLIDSHEALYILDGYVAILYASSSDAFNTRFGVFESTYYTLSRNSFAISHQVHSVLVQSRMFKDVMLCSLFPFSLVGVTGLVKGLITSDDLKQVGNEIVLGIKEQYENQYAPYLNVMSGVMQVAGDCQSAFAAHYNPSAWMVLLGFLIGFICAWVLFIVLLAVVAAKPTNQARVLKRA
ncbi:hypothetical protein K435DRAFT_862488 [Dendrothele bispora CBS 962.96]|uniref:Uncharacterized protein n=1 Tax=Dendrothele bispora (strain CBS 962.96) TaxID=1314807 RepID=A0A4S8LSD6_DENBC|nr:hypothetical protein K435DRAFT_862488 [Dendrothele bispora CBS 962.96]